LILKDGEGGGSGVVWRKEGLGSIRSGYGGGHGDIGSSSTFVSEEFLVRILREGGGEGVEWSLCGWVGKSKLGRRRDYKGASERGI
jgi:hypothetical protein